MTPTEDEFSIWQDNPITAWVLAGVKRFAELQPKVWLAQSWAGGEADQDALTKLRIRADAYAGLAGLTYDQACGLHEPVEGVDQ